MGEEIKRETERKGPHKIYQKQALQGLGSDLMEKVKCPTYICDYLINGNIYFGVRLYTQGKM